MSHWIKLHKSIAENPYWTSEVFTRGQAWVDMLLLTNKAPGFVRKQGVRVDLERGDLGWSEVELSKRWQWSRGKVRRFLGELESDGMICRKNSGKTDKRKFVITIVNYNKYQDKQTSDSTCDRTGSGTSDGQATVQEERVTEEQNTTSSSPHACACEVESDQISMTTEWQPSEFFPTLAETSGIVVPAPEDLELALREFRTFWLAQKRKQTQHKWDLAFVKAIQCGFATPRGKPKNGNRREGGQIQPRSVRDAQAIQGEAIARALLEDKRRKQAGFDDGKAGGVLLEHPV